MPPIYAYECKCRQRTEVLCASSDRKSKVKCGCGRFAKSFITPVAGIVRNPAVPRSKK